MAGLSLKGVHKEPQFKWTTREQLILASSVQRSGDQNWVSVSRAIRPLIEETRSSENFSQKNCAMQYATMLDKASTPKRKRKEDGATDAVETVEEQIVRHLTSKRIKELDKALMKTREEYTALKKEIELLEKGELDDQLQMIWEQIQAESKGSTTVKSPSRKISPLVSVSMKDTGGGGDSEPKPDSTTKTTPIIVIAKNSTQEQSVKSLEAGPSLKPPKDLKPSPKDEPALTPQTQDLKTQDSVSLDSRPLESTLPVSGDSTKPVQPVQPVATSKPTVTLQKETALEGTATPTTGHVKEDEESKGGTTSLTGDGDIKEEGGEREGERGGEQEEKESLKKEEARAVRLVLDKCTPLASEEKREEEGGGGGEGGRDKPSKEKAPPHSNVKEPVVKEDESDIIVDLEAEKPQEGKGVKKEKDTTPPSPLTPRQRRAKKQEQPVELSDTATPLRSVKAQDSGKVQSDEESGRVRRGRPPGKRGRGGRGRPRLEVRDTPPCDEESEEEVYSALSSAVSSPCPSHGDGDPESQQSFRSWRKTIMLVWRHAAQHKYANLFLHPVKEENAPGYYDVVLRPMDLTTIKKNIETGVIRTDVEFQRDMLLMFQNAFMYNSSDHDVYKMAEEMRFDVMENIQEYLLTQMMVQSSTTSKLLRSSNKGSSDDKTPVGAALNTSSRKQSGGTGGGPDDPSPVPGRKRRLRLED